MTADVENLVLEQLRLIRKVGENIREDGADLKVRLSSTERHLGKMQIPMAALNGRMDRMDRFDERLGRRDAGWV